MSANVEQLTREVLTLPEMERAHLARVILRSLESTAEEGVEEAWDEEIARRLERVRQGTAQGRPAEEVFRDIRERHRR